MQSNDDSRFGEYKRPMTTGLTLYAWSTPNGQKPIIMLEELGLPYHLVGVDLGRGQQLTSRYLDINPQGKIPALVDARSKEPVTVTESGAILMYLAESEGRFLPEQGGAARAAVLQWLMFQMSTVGPMLGQANHFRKSAPAPLPYAIERYMNEARRIYRLVNRQLADREFIAGSYSIADMALYPWLNAPAWFGLRASDFPHLARWCRTMSARPAVRTALGTCFVSENWEEPSIAV